MTNEELAKELSKLDEIATPGPWEPSEGWTDGGGHYRGARSDMGEIFGEFSADQVDIDLYEGNEGRLQPRFFSACSKL